MHMYLHVFICLCMHSGHSTLLNFTISAGSLFPLPFLDLSLNESLVTQKIATFRFSPVFDCQILKKKDE